MVMHLISYRDYFDEDKEHFELIYEKEIESGLNYGKNWTYLRELLKLLFSESMLKISLEDCQF